MDRVKQNTNYTIDLEFWEKTADGRDPMELKDLEDIKIDFRKGKNTRSELIVSKSLSGGSVAITVNNLQTEHIFTEAGMVYFDILFKDNGRWRCYYENEINVIENITDV